LRILSIGEILWDVFKEDELLGGAPLNFSANAVRLGNYAALLTAVGADNRGAKALEVVHSLDLPTEFVQISSTHQTGAATVVTDSAGNATYSIARPAAFDDVQLDDRLLGALQTIAPDWIYFGTLFQTQENSEPRLLELIQQMPAAKRFYDINLRDGHWNFPLVERLSGLATIVKLNDDEAKVLSALTFGSGEFSLGRFCKLWCSQYGVEMMVVTLGSHGCAVYSEGTLCRYNGFNVRVVDTVGAGDAFSAAFIHGVDLGWPMDRTAQFANALGATIASRAGATPRWTPEECLQLIESS
jgi:fructokinase